jgi:hypothetical protein
VDVVGHDCDLATLSVDDPAFFRGTQPVRFADELPELGDEVTVIGYPTGGARLSMTRGVVSRLDYSLYSHSGVDQHLVIQVDAAINPGNSGGPIVFRNRVVGLAFQGLAWAENIGYGIPVPVIEHFLTDIRDGTYHGYPELGVWHMDTRNDALRADLGIPKARNGVVVSYLDPFGSALGVLQAGDALLSIDGCDIASDGTVILDGNNVLFAELLERKQWGQSIVFDLWRNGASHTVTVPLRNPPDPFVYRNEYDRLPRFLVYAGLVFAPLSRDYLRTVGRAAQSPNAHALLYFSQYAKIDGLHRGRDEFVVLTQALAHPVNTYAGGFVNGIVTRVNGRPIPRLEAVKAAIRQPTNGYHVIHFADMDDFLVLDAAAAEAAQPQILRNYGVPVDECFGEERP